MGPSTEIVFRDYQEQGIDDLARLAGVGVRRIAFQAATGAGKTVIFSGLTQRYRKKIPKRVIIAVHRKELRKQTVAALKKIAGINAGELIADFSNIVQEIKPGVYVPHNSATVVVCMIETLYKRIQKYEHFLGDVGMLIVDECHIGNFNKIYEYFKEALIVGFTATPLSAKKKFPLNLYFDDIVAPASIQKLIDDGYLSKNITIKIKNGINRKKLKVRGGEFDQQVMASLYSSGKHVQNTVKAYEKYAMGEKTVIFNCNIEHSKLVTEAFVAAGFNCRHLDGNASDELRDETLQWLKETPDAIISSVGLLTTGFDEPTIQAIIVNRATMSLTLWLQMTGRGARIIPGFKETFKIIDLGSNVDTHFDWNYPHDWRDIFHNPERPRNGQGAAPTKLCPQCSAMIHLSQRICPFCFFDNAKEEQYDLQEIELEVFTKGVDVEKIIEQNKKYTPYKGLHLTKVQLVRKFRQSYQHPNCPSDLREMLNTRFQTLVREWCKQEELPYNKFHKEMSRKLLMDELDKVYGKLTPENNAVKVQI